MDVDHRRIEEIRFFLFRLNDRSFVQTPGFVVLRREHEPASVRAEGNITFLSRGICDTLGLALVDGSDVDITPDDEGKFFAIGTQRHVGDVVAVVPDSGCRFAVAQADLDTDLLRLLGSRRQRVDLTIVTETEITIVRRAEEPDWIFFEPGDLLRRSRLTVQQGEAPDIKRSALFGQIVDRAFVRGPDRLPVLALEA